jgi:hypothetical protein
MLPLGTHRKSSRYLFPFTFSLICKRIFCVCVFSLSVFVIDLCSILYWAVLVSLAESPFSCTNGLWFLYCLRPAFIFIALEVLNCYQYERLVRIAGLYFSFLWLYIMKCEDYHYTVSSTILLSQLPLYQVEIFSSLLRLKHSQWTT